MLERAFVLTVLVAFAPGCGGHCDGALRVMRAQNTELCPGGLCTEDNPSRMNEAEPVAIAPSETFRMRGDFKGGESSDAILRASGVTPQTFFLISAAGTHVAATIEADSGGSMCMNGVGFNLRPLQPLTPGAYTLVLLVGDVRWPYVGDDPVSTFEGHRAVTRRYVVR